MHIAKLAHLLLWLSTISAGAFLLLPLLGSISPGLLLSVLAIWVVSASVAGAASDLVKQAGQGGAAGATAYRYAGGIALASAPTPKVATRVNNLVHIAM